MSKEKEYISDDDVVVIGGSDWHPEKKPGKLLSKIVEGHRCGEFEKRGMQRFEERTVLLYEVDNELLLDGFAIHADAFPKVYEVW